MVLHQDHVYDDQQIKGLLLQAHNSFVNLSKYCVG